MVNRKKIEHLLLTVLLLLAGAILLTQGVDALREASVLADFQTDICEQDAFRAMQISPSVYAWVEEKAAENNVDACELLASLLYDNAFQLLSVGQIEKQEATMCKKLLQKRDIREEALTALSEACQAVWADIRYFPVPESTQNADATVSFENTWGESRTYGGERTHEGTDIMATINERGYYPVISITDGVVENVGWLPQGGYRIGIRSPHGGYFYYAHLASYAREFQIGDSVQAGELLGMMGDTGYSEVEGTTGNFDVHLHLGIYIQTENYEELSVNSYYVLQYLEAYKLEYAY